MQLKAWTQSTPFSPPGEGARVVICRVLDKEGAELVVDGGYTARYLHALMSVTMPVVIVVIVVMVIPMPTPHKPLPTPQLNRHQQRR